VLNCFGERLGPLREEARACLRLAKVTQEVAEQIKLRDQAARLAMQAKTEERQMRLGAGR
jgi:hypothetical protein